MFTLLEQVASPSLLARALKEMRRSSMAAGVDGITAARFREDSRDKIESISKALAQDYYRFDRLRAVPIAKVDEGYRPLAIPTVGDRLVQKAILLAIEPYVRKQVRSPGSHAFLKGRGLRTAIRDLRQHIRAGNFCVLRTDIVKFFDRIQAQDALDRLFQLLPDESLRPLMSRYIKWEISGLFALKPNERKAYPADGMTTGLPQGTALSPMLANLLLADLDREARELNYRVVRYADDLIFVGQDSTAVYESFDWYASKLKALQLTVYDPRSESKKAELVPDCRIKGFDYLGFFVKLDRNKILVRPQHSKVERIADKIAKILTRGGKRNLAERILLASRTGEAWISSYLVVCGMVREARRLSARSSKALEQLLTTRGILSGSATLDEKQREFIGLRLNGKRRKRQPKN